MPPKLALLPLFPERPPTDWAHSDLSQIRFLDGRFGDDDDFGRDEPSDNEMTKHVVPGRVSVWRIIFSNLLVTKLYFILCFANHKN